MTNPNTPHIPTDRAWVDDHGNVLDTADKIADHLERIHNTRTDQQRLDQLRDDIDEQARRRATDTEP